MVHPKPLKWKNEILFKKADVKLNKSSFCNRSSGRFDLHWEKRKFLLAEFQAGDLSLNCYLFMAKNERERVNDGNQASYSRVDRQTFPIHCNFAKQESSLSLSLSLSLSPPHLPRQHRSKELFPND